MSGLLRLTFFFLAAGFLSGDEKPPEPAPVPPPGPPLLGVKPPRPADAPPGRPGAPPGPPPGRGGRLPRSSASLTTMRKPMYSLPFISSSARCPPSLLSISTKPKHLLCPVSRSVTTFTLLTGPMAPNHSSKSDSTASRLSLATNNFINPEIERPQATRICAAWSRSSQFKWSSALLTECSKDLQDVVHVGRPIVVEVGVAVA